MSFNLILLGRLLDQICYNPIRSGILIFDISCYTKTLALQIFYENNALNAPRCLITAATGGDRHCFEKCFDHCFLSVWLLAQ